MPQTVLSHTLFVSEPSYPVRAKCFGDAVVGSSWTIFLSSNTDKHVHEGWGGV